jgi:hypothetical protein
MTKKKDPIEMERLRIDRFWEKIDKAGGPDSCWEWQGYRIPLKGRPYGRLTWKGEPCYAHRVAWELANDHPPLVRPEIVRHSCDNAPCCNPSHLFRGTAKDNMRDRDIRGRNGMALFDANQVREIRYQHARHGLSYNRLATMYSCHINTIRDICTRKTYKWV